MYWTDELCLPGAGGVCEMADMVFCKRQIWGKFHLNISNAVLELLSWALFVWFNLTHADKLTSSLNDNSFQKKDAPSVSEDFDKPEEQRDEENKNEE